MSEGRAISGGLVVREVESLRNAAMGEGGFLICRDCIREGDYIQEINPDSPPGFSVAVCGRCFRKLREGERE